MTTANPQYSYHPTNPILVHTRRYNQITPHHAAHMRTYDTVYAFIAFGKSYRSITNMGKLRETQGNSGKRHVRFPARIHRDASGRLGKQSSRRDRKDTQYPYCLNSLKRYMNGKVNRSVNICNRYQIRRSSVNDTTVSELLPNEKRTFTNIPYRLTP